MTLASVVTVLLTGTGYWVAHGALGGITVSDALSPDDPRSSGDNMNILLIGLDSRKDQDGNDLPWSILKQLHAGDSDDGGYNTNTLILVHVGADGKVVAFSIPRDDWVPFTGVPGYTHIKIKEAYGLTKQYVAQKLANQGASSQRELEMKGREAGRTATLRAVRSLTGVPIDYFAEINLAGFYDLAQTLGGVDVCLNHAVYDSYSGADFPAGPQRLNASQALAFVRQRHELDNGDLDRTHRQQAFISSVMRELQAAGTFTNIDKLKSLMAVARKDVVLSSGWDEELIQRLGGLAGGQRRVPDAARGPVRRHRRSERQHHRPGRDQGGGGSGNRRRQLDGADRVGGDHGQQTQPGHRRRRDQLRQLERTRQRRVARVEETRLHHGPGPRSQRGRAVVLHDWVRGRR